MHLFACSSGLAFMNKLLLRKYLCVACITMLLQRNFAYLIFAFTLLVSCHSSPKFETQERVDSIISQKPETNSSALIKIVEGEEVVVDIVFDRPIHEQLTCEGLTFVTNFDTVKYELSSVTFFQDSIAIDTIILAGRGIGGDRYYREDFNFDGQCDFVIVDLASASHGAMNYYYFLYDPVPCSFHEINTIMSRHGGFEINTAKQEIELNCRYSRKCNLIYKFEAGTFIQVSGEFDFDNP